MISIARSFAGMLSILAADLHDPLMLRRRALERRRVFPFVGHRLFDVDVLAGGHRVERHALVPVIGHGDHHGLDVLVVEHAPIVAARADVRAEQLFRAIEVSVVDVADFDDARVGDFLGGADENLAANADADEADADGVVGADRTAASSSGPREAERARRAGRLLHEFPARHAPAMRMLLLDLESCSPVLRDDVPVEAPRRTMHGAQDDQSIWRTARRVNSAQRDADALAQS